MSLVEVSPANPPAGTDLRRPVFLKQLVCTVIHALASADCAGFRDDQSAAAPNPHCGGESREVRGEEVKGGDLRNKNRTAENVSGNTNRRVKWNWGTSGLEAEGDDDDMKTAKRRSVEDNEKLREEYEKEEALSRPLLVLLQLDLLEVLGDGVFFFLFRPLSFSLLIFLFSFPK
ncbi:hypothetical protein FACS189472_14380 [Alphaproteobacteria bacterium]|nr:hypothetical protein FACS189472_14380 [Alphaproteobacteria bacterium]